LLLPNAIPLTLKEHIAIWNAIKRHDADAASAAMQKHLQCALKRYTDSLAEQEPRSGKTLRTHTVRKKVARAIA
jgi:GntR family transcriptional repressor for pyruvate dehydrogenase complex